MRLGLLTITLIPNRNTSRITNHLRPLAISANIFQAPTCRLDHVLLTLGNLVDFFVTLPPQDWRVTETVVQSIETRWKKTDQELFILGVFFNPFIRARYFNKTALPQMGLFHITRRAFLRLFPDTPVDGDFLKTFQEYYLGISKFSDQYMCLDNFIQFKLKVPS